MAATELATAYLSLVPSMGGAQGKIAQELAGVDTTGIGRGMGSRMGGGLVGSFKSLVGPAIAAVAAVGIKDFATNAVNSFSELEDSTAAAGVVFGDSMGSIIAQSKTAGATLGLSSQQVINAANTYGTYGKAAGLAGNDLAKFATDQTKLAADMASFKGTSPEQAIEAIGAALRGETEPIRAYGVMIDDATMRQKALEMGLVSTTKEALEPQNKILAAQALIMEQTKDAHGDFARTSSSTANVAKTLAAESENLSAKLGGALAPAFTAARLAALSGVRGMSGALDTIGPKIQYVSMMAISGIGLIKDVLTTGDIKGKFLEDLGIEEDSPFIAGIFRVREIIQSVLGGIRDFVTGFTIPFDTLTGAFDSAGASMSPMMAAGAGIRDVFAQIWAAVQPLIPSLLDLFMTVSPLQLIFQTITPFLGPIAALMGQLAVVVGQNLAAALAAVLPALGALQSLAVQLFQGVLAVVLPLIVQLIGQLAGTMATLMPVITAVIGVVIGLAMNLLSQLMPIILQLASQVLPMAVSIFGALLTAIGPVIQIIAGLLIPIIQALLPVVVVVFQAVANIIRAAMQIVQGIIQVVTGIISGNWRMVFTGLWNIVQGAFRLVVSIIQGALATVGSLVLGGLSAVSGLFRSVFSGVVSYLGGVWGNITSGVSGMISDVTGFFGGLIGKITGAIGNAGTALWNTGVSIIQGLIDGIGSMMGAIGRAVLNIVPQAIRGPFEDLLGIHSPSRVFRQYGVFTGEGYIEGVEGMYGDVAAAVEGLVHVPEVPSFVNGARATGAASVAYAPEQGGAPGGLVQNVYPREGQSEETIAEISARKIMRAGVR